MNKKETESLQIAYFSMEFGINEQMHTYCGGLGILVGDTIKSASDMGLNMVGMSLLYKNGWLKQQLDFQKGQTEQPDSWDYKKYLRLCPERFVLNIAHEPVTVQIWQYLVKSNPENELPLYFLDVDLPENSEAIRELNDVIYSSNKEVWFKQEALLGIGGAMALEVLGYNNIDVFHLNESHAAYLTLFLKEKYGSWAEVKKRLCFTTHTPLAGAHQKLEIDEVKKYVDSIYIQHLPHEIIENNTLDFTKLCLFASKFSNAVAHRHQEITSQMYADFKIDYITNGVHHPTWTAKPLQDIFDKNILDWRKNPDYLRQAIRLPDNVVTTAHAQSKKILIDRINSEIKIKYEGRNKIETSFNLDDYYFDENVFTIGFARRAVPYKRADFIFSDFQKLQEIAQKGGKIQIIFAGKTSGGDTEGKNQIYKVLQSVAKSGEHLKIFYLENYNMDLGAKLTSGVDMWLNNPLPPLEASGTSGMKAALNGIPSFSVLDGWWPEGHIEGVTGWSIGEYLCDTDECRILEINDIYQKLEYTILPLFYTNKENWTKIMKSCIALNGSHFNTNRMLTEYLVKSYLKERI